MNTKYKNMHMIYLAYELYMDKANPEHLRVQVQ